MTALPTFMKRPLLQRSILMLPFFWMGSGLHAAPLNLMQSPPTSGREPAPNVIVSVDDSASMGQAGMDSLKSALLHTFSAANLPDDRVRLAWQSMNRCRGIPSNSADCRGQNAMARLSGTHRSNFTAWVNRLVPADSTPSHLMIDEAGQYLSRTDLGIRSPWASHPGVEESPVLSCRKSFHIFMTDGAWNTSPEVAPGLDAASSNGSRIVRGGNADNTSIRLPDGVLYDVASPQTRLYRDTWGTHQLSTLSDLAFFYWSRDLQPALANNVRPSPATPWPPQNFGSTQAPAELSAYWNPRNNPATWQHMVNYTIGFNDAASWHGQPAWMGDTHQNLGGLINGTAHWPTPFCSTGLKDNSPCDGREWWGTRENERKVELWHAALNSRGRFVPATSPSALTDAFQGILDDILTQSAQPLVSIASSSRRLRSDGHIYLAGYDTSQWSGSLSAYGISASSQGISPKPLWSAHHLLDSAALDVNARNVLTHNGSSGIAFRWDLLNEDQRKSLQGPDTEAQGRRILDYLRGHRGQEIGQSGGTLRRRGSRLGDIVNANIWQTKQPGRMEYEHEGHKSFRSELADRPPMLYVGANDGMLHAFSALTGQELMAYVPRGVYHHLRSYAQPGYRHRYFVDGQAFTGDADVSGRGIGGNGSGEPQWRTVLVGSLGGGGRGYFVLDVTQPPASPGAATSFKPASVLLDHTFPGNSPAPDETTKDIGHVYAQPAVNAVDMLQSEQIVKLNNGRWAVVMGNGINSVNERPVLLIQFLDGSRDLQRIVADDAKGQANGLSAPRLIDVNGDGTADIAYAGDMHGQLWKFNLTHADATQWGVSNWTGGTTTCRDTSCTPFFTARDAGAPSHVQPITIAPMWMPHPMGGFQILFGTGRSVEETDRKSQRVQTLYSLWDKSEQTAIDLHPIARGRLALVQQTVTGNVGSRANGTEVPTAYFNTSRNAVRYSRSDTDAPRGWYMDLPEPGERVLSDPQLFEGQKVIVPTMAPSQGEDEETCRIEETSDKGWLTVLNMITGQPAQIPVFAMSNASGAMANASRVRSGNGEFTAISVGRDLNLITIDPDCKAADSGCTATVQVQGGQPKGKRADWREIR